MRHWPAKITRCKSHAHLIYKMKEGGNERTMLTYFFSFRLKRTGGSCAPERAERKKSPISGRVDKRTQRGAWRIGTYKTVMETGL